MVKVTALVVGIGPALSELASSIIPSFLYLSPSAPIPFASCCLVDGQVLLENLHLKAHAEAKAKGAPFLAYNKALNGWEATVQLPFGDIHFFKPKALMNVSGGPVQKAILHHFKIPPTQLEVHPDKLLFVLHDELEIARNTSRYRSTGSLKGHRGLEDIAKVLKTKNIERFGVGIGRPTSRTSAAVAAHVLSPLNRIDLQAVEYNEHTGQCGPLLKECWERLQACIAQRTEQMMKES